MNSYHYLGCFKDNIDRALPSAFAEFQNNSIEACTTHCRSQGKFGELDVDHRYFKEAGEPIS